MRRAVLGLGSVALAIDYGVKDFRVEAGHFVERHGEMIISNRLPIGVAGSKRVRKEPLHAIIRRMW